MKPVLAVFTGGTIGTVRNDDNIMSLSDIGKYELIEHYKNNYNDDNITIMPVKPLNVLSEHMRFSDINKLLDYLKTVDFNDYSGIIITHGTDTLSYTANILGIALNNLEIPVMIVSSNLPLNDVNCDGHINFRYALKFIKENAVNNVFVIFKEGERVNVHLGVRILQNEHFTDRFRSINDSVYAYYEKDKLIINERLSNNSKEKLLHSIKKPLDGNVLFIKPYTGFDYSNLNVKGYKAVLVETFHSGTVNGNLDKDQYSIFSLIGACKKENIPIYIAPVKYSQKTENASMYEGVADIYKMVYPIYGTSAVNAYCKLIIAMSLYNKIEEINAFLDTNLNYERIENL